jgi:hypothetical protein
MRTLFAALFLCCTPLLASAQVVDTPFLKTGDTPGLTVTRTGHFDGSALFGYMDGGAELYREYGFVDLTVQELEVGRHQLLLELFRMRDSLAAFGIFSVFRGGCLAEDSTAQFWCHSSGQVVCAAGRYFFRVQRLTGGTDASEATTALAKKVLSTLPDSTLPGVPWVVGKTSPQGWQSSAVVVCGPVGLQNGYPDWTDPLEGGGYRFITIVPMLIESKPATLGWIQCATDKDATILGTRMALHKRPHWQFIRQHEDTSFLVIDSDLPADRLERFAGTLLNK